MFPTYRAGDWLMVKWLRTPRSRERLKVGDCVIIKRTQASELLAVKRIAAIVDGRFEVRGDNPTASSDSRDYGSIEPQEVIAKVIARYFRAGDGAK